MRRKRILICEDDHVQYGILKEILCAAGYDVFRSEHWQQAVDDLKKYRPIHLLILDLGFKKDIFEGHKCVPDVAQAFPDVKIIVRSRLETELKRTQEANRVYAELHRCPNVRDYLNPSQDAGVVRSVVDRTLQTCSWLHDGELWLLHVSDMQLGGAGIPGEPEAFVDHIANATNRFVQDRPHDEEEGRGSTPASLSSQGTLRSTEGPPSLRRPPSLSSCCAGSA